jgi:hypothetical protein
MALFSVLSVAFCSITLAYLLKITAARTGAVILAGHKTGVQRLGTISPEGQAGYQGINKRESRTVHLHNQVGSARQLNQINGHCWGSA